MTDATQPTQGALAKFLAERSELPLRLPAGLSLRARVLRAREPLLTHGEASDRAYVVYSGLLEARSPEPASHRLRWLGSGAWVGELGVLMGSPRTATVLAWRDSAVIEVEAEATRALLTSSAEQLAALTRHLLRRGRRGVEARPRPFVLGVLLVDGDAALVRAAVERTPEAALVRAEGWRDDDVAAVERLERAGGSPRLRVLLAEPGQRAWTEMVLRAADRVAVIARDAPQLAAQGLERARGCDVLLHGPAPRDAGPSPSLAIRADCDDDLVDYLATVLGEYARPERLRTYEIFAGLDDAALTQAQEAIDWRMVRRGEPLIRAGEPSDGLYLISSGRLEASAINRDGERVLLSESGAREVVGDTGLILGSARTADVFAKRDSRVGFLSRRAFERLQRFIPQLGQNAARIASRRTLVPSGARLGPDPTDIMILRLDACERSAAVAQALARSVREELGRSTLLVTRARIEAELGRGAHDVRPGEPGYRRLLAWLHRASLEHDVILYECAADDARWARCCARQADRALLLAGSDRDVSLRPIERDLGVELPTELVLMQPAGISRAAGTREWLRRRAVEGVHHVRDGCPADVSAAARRLMTRANGVAFAGASTRAPAHCGVARALQALGLPLDVVAGSSAGAVIAGGLAAGCWELDELRDRVAVLGERARIRVRDLGPPVAALTSGARFSGLFQELFGAIELEDLLIPARFSAVDLLTHELVYLDRGPMWLAARASCSLPVVYPPVTLDGRVLVDGGIISYIPINAILPSCQRGLAVMSNISDPSAWDVLRSVEPYGAQVSGWTQLAARMLPGRDPKVLPKMMDVLFLSLIASNSLSADRIDAASKHPAVCHIYQPLTGFGMWDVTLEVAREFETLTYERAVPELRAWLEGQGRAQASS
ncbi:MAG: cyclic nucleotide-binding domain-containing protein [Nannocystaceae bacterium]